MIYLGHLDLVRHLPRTFPARTCPGLFRQGSAPPELTFSPALGLYAFMAEYLDAKLTEQVDPAVLWNG